MSCHPISKAFPGLADHVPAGATDSRGVPLSLWCEFGAIGWNAARRTFVIRVAVHEAEPLWQFGEAEREIESPYMLAALVSRVLARDVELDETIERDLLAERDANLGSATHELPHFRACDAMWNPTSVHHHFTSRHFFSDYIRGGYRVTTRSMLHAHRGS
jgi:hypothetical protein